MTIVSSSFSNEAIFDFHIITTRCEAYSATTDSKTWNTKNRANLYFIVVKFADDALVSAAMADACAMVHPACLFMKTHLLALLQKVYWLGFVVLSCASCLHAWGI